MNSKTLHASATSRGGSDAAVTPDGIIPNTYYDNENYSKAISCCSTPYVSAPSSPGRGAPPVGYFYSAPSSPMHHLLKSSVASNSSSGAAAAVAASDRCSFEFDFGVSGPVDDDDYEDRSSTMSSADELFLNGQIRPMKLSCHLQRPQILAPLIDVEEEEVEAVRGRDLKKMRDRSLRRKARSLSPLRTEDWNDVVENEGEEKKRNERSKIIENNNPSTSSSSKRWVFLKDFIRSKSAGSTSATAVGSRLWSSISFSHRGNSKSAQTTHKPDKLKAKEELAGGSSSSRLMRNGTVTRRSAQYEAHYTAKRAQAEEMRRKTFLPYRQGLLGCLGFSSKGYGAMDGFTRALNSVSSQ